MHIFRREANTDGLRFLSDVFTVVELDGQRSSWDGKFGKLRQILLINGEVADTDDAAALSSKVLSRLIVKQKVNQWGRSTGMPNVEQLLQIHPSVLEGSLTADELALLLACAIYPLWLLHADMSQPSAAGGGSL